MKKLSILFACLAAALAARAQEDSLTHRPFHLSLFTPFSTNGMESYSTVNRFSLNLFYSGSAGVQGIELGGFANYTRYFVEGVQMAGFANIVGQRVKGFQTAGFANIVGGRAEGFQGAGFANLVAGSAKGVQLAGFANIAAEHEGAQVAGFANLAQDKKGSQVAGFLNVGRSAKGVQVAGFANVAREVQGIQVAGFLNVAKKLNGLQVGFLNFADSVESGTPVGFLSFVGKNGYHKMDIWADELFFTNVAYKGGTSRLYNIIGVGSRFQASPFAFSITYGLGTEIPLGNRSSLNPELLFQQFYSENFQNNHFWSFAPQLRPVFKYQLNDKLGIYAGPTLRLLFIDSDVSNLPFVLEDWALSQSSTNRHERIFTIGVAAGISLF